MSRRSMLLCAGLACFGCLPDNPSLDAGTEESGETGGLVPTGPLACDGECTVVLVSQTLDDRVEFFAMGETPRYRGALELDLKPNPGGDNTGSNLDEPYGLRWTGQGLAVILGHFPAIDSGSIAVFSPDWLAQHDAGDFIETEQWWLGNQPVDGVRFVDLEQLEPLFLHVHPSGRWLVGAFNNDLFAAESTWTNAAVLLVVDPETGDVARAPELSGCAGGWSLEALDGPGQGAGSVALACDGDEGVAIVDTSALGTGSLADDASSMTFCVADIGFPDKRTRYLARDGHGGVVVAESTPVPIQGDETRMWRYDGACELQGFATLPGDGSWDLRQIRYWRSQDGGDQWLAARADGDERGIHVLAASGSDAPTRCGRVSGFDDHLDGGGVPIGPHALELARGGEVAVVGAGPRDVQNMGPGYGKLLWAELAGEGCEVAADVTDLSAEGPAVEAGLPQTWRRAPNQISVVSVGEP